MRLRGGGGILFEGIEGTARTFGLRNRANGSEEGRYHAGQEERIPAQLHSTRKRVLCTAQLSVHCKTETPAETKQESWKGVVSHSDDACGRSPACRFLKISAALCRFFAGPSTAAAAGSLVVRIGHPPLLWDPRALSASEKLTSSAIFSSSPGSTIVGEDRPGLPRKIDTLTMLIAAVGNNDDHVTMGSSCGVCQTWVKQKSSFIRTSGPGLLV